MRVYLFLTAALLAAFWAVSTEADSRSRMTNSLGMTFVLVEAGDFVMGSPPGEMGGDRHERPAHRVTLTRDFYMQTTEVTQGQWRKIMGENPARFRECGPDCPVEQVTYEMVREFIKRLNMEEEAGTYRLPTEAEWEYACRGGTDAATPYGDLDEAECDEPVLARYAWFCGDSTHPVAAKGPNPLGLHDMLGNVWEMTSDWFGPYVHEHIVDQSGPPVGEERVIRGGGWYDAAAYCRCAKRYGLAPDTADSVVGFRLVWIPALES